MPVGVVLVWHVRMRMPCWRVQVCVTVRTGWRRIVRVSVMPVIVTVRVLVLQHRMRVVVCVSFHDVKEDTHDHERPAAEQPRAPGAFAKSKGQEGADKGRKSEYRTGPRGAKGALCQKVKTQAQAIPRRTDQEEC